MFDDTITNYEYHTYQPRSQNYGNNDEIRIVIQQQDILTLVSESYIKIAGKIKRPTGTTTHSAFVRNGSSFLFNEARFEVNGTEIDKIRDVGVVSTMKGYLTIPSNDFLHSISGWNETGKFLGYNDDDGSFVVHIPLKFWFGFAEDHQKILTNVKQELILMRSSSDRDVFKAAFECAVEIDKISWNVPHLQINDEIRLKLLSQIKNDVPIIIPFR